MAAHSRRWCHMISLALLLGLRIVDGARPDLPEEQSGSPFGHAAGRGHDLAAAQSGLPFGHGAPELPAEQSGSPLGQAELKLPEEQGGLAFYRAESLKPRAEHLFSGGLAGSKKLLEESAADLGGNVEDLNDASGDAHTTIDRYDEHVHDMDIKLNGLDEMLSKLIDLRTRQFGQYEGDRMSGFDTISPHVAQEIQELQAAARDRERQRLEHEQAMKEAMEAASGREDEEKSAEHMAKLLAEVKRSGNAGAGIIQEAYKLVKELNNRSSTAPAADSSLHLPGGSHEDSEADVEDSPGVPMPEEMAGANFSLLDLSAPGFRSESASENLENQVEDMDSTPQGAGSEDRLEERSEGMKSGDNRLEEEVDSKKSGDEGWNHLDKEGLIKKAGDLVPEDQRGRAEEMFNSLPSDKLRARNPEFFRNVLGEASVKKYKESMVASNDLYDTGRTLAENAAKTTQAVVNAHKKMEEWHSAVKSNIKDLETLDSSMKENSKDLLRELKDSNFDRLESFDKLVGIGDAAKNEVDIHGLR